MGVATFLLTFDTFASSKLASLLFDLTIYVVFSSPNGKNYG